MLWLLGLPIVSDDGADVVELFAAELQGLAGGTQLTEGERQIAALICDQLEVIRSP